LPGPPLRHMRSPHPHLAFPHLWNNHSPLRPLPSARSPVPSAPAPHAALPPPSKSSVLTLKSRS
jgi:hypothetical protein